MQTPLVQEWMTSPVTTVSPESRLADAGKAMSACGIRALPVVKQGQLVGLATQADIYRSDRSPLAGADWPLVRSAEPLRIAEVMTPDPLTVQPEAPAALAARLLLENSLHALPVLNPSGELAGILTASDLFRLVLAYAPTWKGDLLVRDYMTADPVTITPDTTLHQAHLQMGAQRIHALPVVAHEELIGIVTETDLLCADFPQPRTHEQKQLAWQILNEPVKHIMTRKIVTIAPDAPLTAAAQAMLDHKIHCLPVLKDDRLTGILCQSDLFRLVVRKLL